MFISLVSGQITQTLQKLRIDKMTIKAYHISFQVDDLLKQSKPGNVDCVPKLAKYPKECNLCMYSYLLEYMKKTINLKGSETLLFISYQKPHKPISKDTIARWLKTVVNASGLDTNVYKAYSNRAASMYAADKAHVPMEDIFSTAG